jgi:fibronectin-binding autotransporter adhesin
VAAFEANPLFAYHPCRAGTITCGSLAVAAGSLATSVAAAAGFTVTGTTSLSAGTTLNSAVGHVTLTGAATLRGTLSSTSSSPVTFTLTAPTLSADLTISAGTGQLTLDGGLFPVPDGRVVTLSGPIALGTASFTLPGTTGTITLANGATFTTDECNVPLGT